MLELNNDPVFYPSSDGEPMGENDIICHLMATSLDVLSRHFQEVPDVYVSSNSFVYYVEGDSQQRVAPDLYVVRGVPNKMRPNYKIWEEGVTPQVVFEFTTESSRYKDVGIKKGLYEALGVQEYYLFDPVEEYLDPPFRAFDLQGGVLVERTHKARHHSALLGLDLKPDGRLLRFYPKDSITPLPTSQELVVFANQQAERAEAEAARAEAEAARAEAEATRASELERELEELRARLKGH